MPPTKRNLGVVETIAEIQSDASFFIVREFISPYIDALYPCEENGMRSYVTKEEFFRIIRKSQRNAEADDEEAQRGVGFMSTGGGGGAERPTATVRGGITDLEYAEYSVWTAIMQVATAVQSAMAVDDVGGGGGGDGANTATATLRNGGGVPERCASLVTLRSMAVLLVDGVVTDKRQRTALEDLLNQHYDETGRRIIHRNEFVVLLQSNQARKEALRSLDFERVAFYLFPDDVMDVFILRKLVYMTRKAPSQHSFVTSYCERKMAQLADVIDLLWFLPFLAMYVAVVISSKGLLPRSYTGYGIYRGLSNAVETIQFPQCYRNDSNVINCDGGMIGMGDVDNAEKLYGFLRGHTSEVFWPDEEVHLTAAQTMVANALRPVGALKIRQFRTPGLVDTSLPEGFFASVAPNGTDVKRYPPYAADEVSTATIPEMANDPLIHQYALMPWDGSRFASCAELNSSSSINGLNKDYGCDGHALIIPINATKEGYTAVIDRTISNNWIDVSTRAVFVEYFLFHQNSGMFFSMTHIFEFQAGGAVTNMVDCGPFNFHDRVTQSLGNDVLYFVFIAYLAVLIIKMLMKLRKRKITSEQVTWVLLDLTNYALFVVAIVMRLIWMSYGGPSADERPVWQVEYFPDYNNVASQFTNFVTIDAFNAILSILAVFRYTKFVPGLDNVVNTVQRSMANGITVAFFAFVLLFAFAICGCIVYGNMPGYQTVPTAAQSIIVIMWGDFEFRPLHAEQPTFTFFFFAVMNLSLIAILMSSIIAVFTDAFSDEKDSAFDSTFLTAILKNNPHHTLEQATWRTVIFGFAPIQLTASLLQRVYTFVACKKTDKYGFDRYDENIAHALQCVLLTSPSTRGGGHSGGDGADAMPSVTTRAVAASELIALMELHVRAPNWDPVSVVRRDAVTSVYDYAELIFDSRIDYVLTMTLYVLIPQDKFNQSGVSLLSQAARAQKRWAERMRARTVSITDEEQLQLRVASVANTEGILGGTDVGSMPIHPEGSAEALVTSMSLLNCRVFLGILASASQSYFEAGERLSEARFCEIAAAMDKYPLEALPPARLYSILGLTDFEDRVKAKSKKNNNNKYLSTSNTTDAMGSTSSPFPTKGSAMPFMKDFVPLFQGEFANQCLSCHFSQRQATAFEVECLREHGKDETADRWEANADAEIIKEAKLTREQFRNVWKRAIGGYPSQSLLDRIYAIFPNGELSSSLFLTYCRGNPHAHHCMSFQQDFARSMDRYSSFLAWATFYVPFIVVILYFLLIGYNLGEVVHVSESLKADFKPDGSQYRREDINDWLFQTIDEMYLDDDGPARIHNQANYYVGAVRIRQHRVDSDEREWCKKVYEVYFGGEREDGTKYINYPPTMQAPALRQFYQDRVDRDFSDLVRGECYSAYSVGSLRSEKDIELPSGHTVSAEVLRAFKYQSVDGYSTNCHDSSYAAGGYVLDISFQTNGTTAKGYLKELRDNNWISTNTRFVVVEFSTYNYNLQMYTYSQFGFEVTDGGAMHPIGKVLSSPQTPLADTAFIVFTVLLFILVVIYIVLVVLEITNLVRLSPSYFYDNLFVAVMRTLWSNPWTIVDLYIICCFVASWLWRLTLIGREELKSLTNDHQYPLDLENYCTYCDLVQKVEGTTLFLVFVRFLQILSFNPRISLLFRTVVMAASDLLSVLVLFVIALFSFALGYILLFGYYVDQSFNIQNAFFDLFSTTMGGPPSYPIFQPHRRNVALFFQIAFIIVCVFILYNMVVAVLTGALGKVKDSMYDASEAKEVRDQNTSDNFNNVNVLRFVRKVKDFSASLFMIREIVQCVQWLRSCCSDDNAVGATPISNKCRSQRTLWSNFARWWSAVDSRTPKEAVLGGLNILRLTQEVRDAKDIVYEQHKEQIMLAAESRHYSLGSLNDHTDEVFKMEELNDHVVNGDHDLIAMELPAFHTYGRSRLPIWEEYLFSKLREEFISMKRHMIMVPSALLRESEEALWLQALEAHHYFTAEREKYNVDCDGSALLDMYEMLPDVNTVVIESTGGDVMINNHRGAGGGGSMTAAGNSPSFHDDDTQSNAGPQRRIVRRLSLAPAGMPPSLLTSGVGGGVAHSGKSPQEGSLQNTHSSYHRQGGGGGAAGTFAKRTPQQPFVTKAVELSYLHDPSTVRRSSSVRNSFDHHDDRHHHVVGSDVYTFGSVSKDPTGYSPLNADARRHEQEQEQGHAFSDLLGAGNALAVSAHSVELGHPSAAGDAPSAEGTRGGSGGSPQPASLAKLPTSSASTMRTEQPSPSTAAGPLFVANSFGGAGSYTEPLPTVPTNGGLAHHPSAMGATESPTNAAGMNI